MDAVEEKPSAKEDTISMASTTGTMEDINMDGESAVEDEDRAAEDSDPIYGNSPQSKFVKIEDLAQYVEDMKKNIEAVKYEFDVCGSQLCTVTSTFLAFCVMFYSISDPYKKLCLHLKIWTNLPTLLFISCFFIEYSYRGS